MAITHRTSVLLNFPLCCASIAILATALATQNWLVATSVYDGSLTTPNNINYGLFTGNLVINSLATPRAFQLYMTCLVDVNVCALSCLGTAEERQQQVRDLYETGTSNDDCIQLIRLTSELGHYPNQQGSSLKNAHHKYLTQGKDNKFEVDMSFINMGLWASTIAFIALALLMAIIGAVFSVINTAGNPVEPILGILGLFIWNAIAAAAVAIALVLWGVQFATTLISNAALDQTISGETSSNGRAALGYSYWILFGSVLVHATNIGLLFYRRNLINREPPAPTIQLQEDPDGAIFLY